MMYVFKDQLQTDRVLCSQVTLRLTLARARDNPDSDIDIGGENEGNTITVSPATGFLNFGTGIYVSENAPSSTTVVDIVENTVENAISGITVANVIDATHVYSNEVSLHDHTSGAGIEVLNGVSTFVWSNAVDGIYKHTDQYGIHIDGGDFASLICNTTENAGIGIHFENTSDPQGLAKNRMDDNLTGLQLTDCFAFDIGTATDGWDNSWYGNDDFDTYTQTTNADGKYIYYSSGGYPLQPLVNGTSTTGQNFETDPATNPLSWLECPVGVGTQKTDSEEDMFSQEHKAAIVMAALSDTVPSAIYPEERAWVRRYHLYQLLDSREGLRNTHPSVTAFYDSSRTANAGKLWAANAALRPDQLSLSSETALSQMGTLSNMGTSIAPEAALRDVLKVMLESTTDPQYMVDTVLYRAQQHLQGILGMEELGGLPVPETRTRKLTEEQYATVVELAEQCPYEYGPAVYMARALRMRNDRHPISYRNACEDVESGKRNAEGGMHSAPEELSYRLYPNPNAGEFTLSLTMEDHDVAAMTVWNISGQQVHAQQLSNGQNTVNLRVAEGLYLYRVTVSGRTQWTGKIAISSY